jgi:hypothetical protein
MEGDELEVARVEAPAEFQVVNSLYYKSAITIMKPGGTV